MFCLCAFRKILYASMKEKNIKWGDITLKWQKRREETLEHGPQTTLFLLVSILIHHTTLHTHTDLNSRCRHPSHLCKHKVTALETLLKPHGRYLKGLPFKMTFHTSFLKSINYSHGNKNEKELFWICLSKDDTSFKISCKMCVKVQINHSYNLDWGEQKMHFKALFNL